MLVNEETMKRIKQNEVTFKKLVKIAKQNASVDEFQATSSSREEFVEQITKATSTSDTFIIVSYSRGKLNQVNLNGNIFLISIT